MRIKELQLIYFSIFFLLSSFLPGCVGISLEKSKLLRDQPLIVPAEEAKHTFGLNTKFQPLIYFQNDFHDNENETISDHSTGLMWEKSGSYPLVYHGALRYIRELKRNQFAGHGDWRLPTVDELKSLLKSDRQSNNLYIDPVFDSLQKTCWSIDKVTNDISWFVTYERGVVGAVPGSIKKFVRAVRNE